MSITQHGSNSTFDLGQDVVMAQHTEHGSPQSPDGVDGALSSEQSDLAAAVFLQRAQRRSRARLRRGLSGMVRRGRVSHRAALAALLAEDDHIGSVRDPAQATHAEILVQAAAKRGADIRLNRSQRRLNRIARRVDRLRARQAILLERAGHRRHHLVRHPDGGHGTVADLERYQAAQRAQIDMELAAQSRKHHRMPRWIGGIPKLVLLLDFCLLLYFFAGITDVDWSSPLSVNLVFAVLLAAMVTTLCYGFLTFAGYRLRGYKDHSGAVEFGNLDALTWIACGASVCGIAVIASLMFIRMRTEVSYALGPQGGATVLVIALVLAIVSVLANFLVVAIHALDGSDQVARLNSLSAATSGPLSKARRMQAKASLIPHRITVRQRRAHRLAIRAITQAGRYFAVVDEVIDAAHAIHQSTGPHSRPPIDPNHHDHVAGYRNPQSAPRPDLRPLDQSIEHIDAAPPKSGDAA